MSTFCYYDNGYTHKQQANTLVVEIPTGIVTKAEIFSIYSEKFSFPAYFGFNWDALYDCLNDLSWIPEYNIIVVHEDLPFLNDSMEREKYIKLLSDVVMNNKESSTRNFRILFPEKYKHLIGVDN